MFKKRFHIMITIVFVSILVPALIFGFVSAAMKESPCNDEYICYYQVKSNQANKRKV